MAMTTTPLQLTLHERLDFDWESHDADVAACVCVALLQAEILARGEPASGVRVELQGRATALGVGREETFSRALAREAQTAGLGGCACTWNPDRRSGEFAVVVTVPMTARFTWPGAREGDLLAVTGEPGERAALRSLAASAGGWDRLLQRPPSGVDRAIRREAHLAPPRRFAALLRRDRLRGLASLARGLPAAAADLAAPLRAEIWIEDLPMGVTAHRAAEKERSEVCLFALLETAEPELLMALEPSEYFYLERVAGAEGLRISVIGRVVEGTPGLSRVMEGSVPVALAAPKRLEEDFGERGDA
jgi:hypothetical protein